MRIVWTSWGLGALIAAGLILSNQTPLAAQAPQVHVIAVVKNGNVQLEVESSGPFEYTTYRPSATLYVIDLSGVAAADAAGGIHPVPSQLVKSYRVISFAAGTKPGVRVEIQLKQGVEPRLERKGSQNLTLLVSPADEGGAPVPSAPPPAPLSPTRTVEKPPDAKNVVAPSGSIEQVHLAQDGGAAEITITGSGPLKFHALHLQDPDRLVLDFAGSHLNTTENHIASTFEPVHAIRLGQFTPETTRLVIDLSEPARYGITAKGNTVTVTLSPRP
ncbi:MAG TPA: AMIN domain-containing protein [Candidatus Acidoferrales bacterium]